jgi:hypothetical protein
VKVKRGLFSYPGEEHLPGQNDKPDTSSAAYVQVHANMYFIEILNLMP